MANTLTAPEYCSYPSLMSAKNRIQNPPEQKPYEHHVASWACTMLMAVFSGRNWIVTPERQDPNTRKKPDLIVEGVNSQMKSPELRLLMELKAVNGDGLEKVLAQTVDPNVLAETVQDMGAETGQYEFYVVVQRGTKIAFFEYHSDIDSMEEEIVIPNFMGCISLTQNYDTTKNVLQDMPEDLGPLFEDSGRKQKQLKKKKDQEVRELARNYTEPCVFDLEKHEEYINFLFNYMAKEKPRSWQSSRERMQEMDRRTIGAGPKSNWAPFPRPSDSSSE